MTDLPEGWEWSTLGEVGKYLNGRGFKKSEWSETGRPIIRIQNLTGSGGTFNRYDGEADERHVVRDGDLLASWAATLGVYVWRGEEAVLNQHIFKVESDLFPPFHRYLLAYVLQDLERQTHGSGMVHITKGRFDSTPAPVPPWEEQERIVAAIEEHLSRLDATDRALRRAAHRIRSLQRRFLRDAFDEPALRRRLGDTAAVVSGQTPRGLGDARPGPVPLFKVGDMNLVADGVLRESRTMLARSEVERLGLHIRPAGTIVFPKRGGAIATNKKRVLGVAGAFDLNTMGVIAGPELDPSYLRWWFETVDLASLSDGSNVPQINHDDISSLTVPVPSLATQRSVVAGLETQWNQLALTSRTADTAQRRIAALRRSILAAAFAGKLVPQDPSDESASVLLKRIRAERAATSTPKRKGRRPAAAL